MLGRLPTSKGPQEVIAGISASQVPSSKKELSAEAFDNIHRVIEVSPVFKKNLLLNYADSAMSPLGLPYPVIQTIHEYMNGDSALLRTFVHRLSEPMQYNFAESFYRKSGLVANIFTKSSSYGTSLPYRWQEAYAVYDVMKGEFPADFALFMYPNDTLLMRNVSSSELNRNASFSLFSKTLEERLKNQSSDLRFQWYPAQKELHIQARSDGWELIRFHYDKNYPSRDLLTVQRIDYASSFDQAVPPALVAQMAAHPTGPSLNLEKIKAAHERAFISEMKS